MLRAIPAGGVHPSDRLSGLRLAIRAEPSHQSADARVHAASGHPHRRRRVPIPVRPGCPGLCRPAVSELASVPRTVHAWARVPRPRDAGAARMRCGRILSAGQRLSRAVPGRPILARRQPDASRGMPTLRHRLQLSAGLHGADSVLARVVLGRPRPASVHALPRWQAPDREPIYDVRAMPDWRVLRGGHRDPHGVPSGHVAA